MTSIERMKKIAKQYGLKLTKVKSGNGGIKINIDGKKKSLDEIGYESLFNKELVVSWAPSEQVFSENDCYSNNYLSSLAA